LLKEESTQSFNNKTQTAAKRKKFLKFVFVILAAHYYKLSADQGDADAQFNYGILFSNGEGLAQDKSVAAHYYQLPADQGNADSQVNYAILLQTGGGIAQDKSLAAHDCKFSADQGKLLLQSSSGILLSNGDGTLPGHSLGVEAGATLTVRGSRPRIGASPAELPALDLTALEPRGHIGRGSFGVVHGYFDPVSGRELAVKSVSPTAECMREVAILAPLDHPVSSTSWPSARPRPTIRRC
jgi:hypothetical protein